MELYFLADSIGSWIFAFCFPAAFNSAIAGLEEAKNLAGKCPPPDSGALSDTELDKNLGKLSSQFAATPNRRFEFKKRRQDVIRAHNETLSIVAVRVCNPDRSPFKIQRLGKSPSFMTDSG